MIHAVENSVWQFIERSFPGVYSLIFPRRRALKYVIAGGTAACVDVGMLYVAKEYFRFELIPAVSIAFFFGFCASFLFQKFWAFEDKSVDVVHKQVALYFLVAGTNFFLNIIFMFLLVEVVHIWYILAKIIVSGSIAFISFFIYKIFIFKKSQYL